MRPRIGSYVKFMGSYGKIIDCPCSNCDAHSMVGGKLIAVEILPDQIWNSSVDVQDNSHTGTAHFYLGDIREGNIVYLVPDREIDIF